MEFSSLLLFGKNSPSDDIISMEAHHMINHNYYDNYVFNYD